MQMNIENLMINEKNDTQNVTFYLIQFIYNIQTRSVFIEESRLVVVKCCGKEVLEGVMTMDWDLIEAVVTYNYEFCGAIAISLQ